MNWQRLCIWFGTSPRLWGDCHQVIGRDPLCRYIPTPVGRLLTLCADMTIFTVHPHACGEIETTDMLWAALTVHPHACGEIYTDCD